MKKIIVICLLLAFAAYGSFDPQIFIKIGTEISTMDSAATIKSRGVDITGSTSGAVSIEAVAVAGTVDLVLPQVNTTMPEDNPATNGEFLTATTLGVQSYKSVVGNGTFAGTEVVPLAATNPIQKHTYTGASAQTLTSLGTLSEINDGTIFYLVGTSDTNTLTAATNDAANGWLLNGSIILKKGVVIQLIKDNTIERFIEISRSN